MDDDSNNVNFPRQSRFTSFQGMSTHSGQKEAASMTTVHLRDNKRNMTLQTSRFQVDGLFSSDQYPSEVFSDSFYLLSSQSFLSFINRLSITLSWN